MKSSVSDLQFKGWTKPGPTPPGVLTGQPALEPGETLDAVSGFYRLFQLEKGHRFSTDDVLTAWYGTSWAPRAERVLDLGSGVGTVANIAAWRCPWAQFVTIEAQEESVRLAKKSAEWNGLLSRMEIRSGDFRDPSVLSPEEKFDLVLGSPPYFPLGTGVEGDHPQKVACRFEVRGTVIDYCAVAAQHLKPGGWFACVFPISPEDQANRVKEGAQASGLSIVRRRPVVLREGERPLLGLFGMMKSVDLPEAFRQQTWEEPPLIIRTEKGVIHPEYSAIKLSFGFPP